MTFGDLSPWANHLWQSTLFAAVAWLLTLALRKNRAAVRYGLWLAASVKFLIPFSLLVSAGAQLGWRAAPAVAQPRLSFVMEEVARPFALPAPTPLPFVTAPAWNLMPAILLGVWLCGVAIGMVFWLRWWRRIGALRRAATPLDLKLPIQVMSSPGRLEPGVIGIVRPVLLLPEGITERLTGPQLEAICAHELRHVHRRDNLTAAIHMLVETLFWFHPLVWWIRARLMEERERACDEGVLRLGGEPRVYAEGILKVCEFYLASPVACAAGVTGGELRKRIEGIMANHFAREVSFGKRVLLVSAAIAAIAGPITVGMVNAPLGRAQSPKAAAPNRLAFEAASVRKAAPQGEGAPNQARSTGRCREDPGRITCIGSPLKLVLTQAYEVNDYQVVGPAWMETEKYDIIATKPAGARKEQTSAMWQRLLVERFRMSVRRESRELPVYALVVGKNGPKLKKSADPDDHAGFTWGNGHLRFRVPTLDHLARGLTFWMGRPVINMTGIEGRFDIALDISTEGLAGVHLTSGPTDGDPAPSVFTAVQEFGLRLDNRKAPIDCIVIDKAEKVPVEN